MAIHTIKSAATNCLPQRTLEDKWCTRATPSCPARTSKIKTYWLTRAWIRDPRSSSKIWSSGSVNRSGTCLNSPGCNVDPCRIRSKTARVSGIRAPIHRRKSRPRTILGIKIDNLMRRQVKISISYSSPQGKVGDKTLKWAITKNYRKPIQNLKLCPYTTSSITRSHLATITTRILPKRHLTITALVPAYIFRIMIRGSLLTIKSTLCHKKKTCTDKKWACRTCQQASTWTVCQRIAS